MVIDIFSLDVKHIIDMLDNKTQTSNIALALHVTWWFLKNHNEVCVICIQFHLNLTAVVYMSEISRICTQFN